jgi:ABC-type multidrug transport system fused ATPase/permease subunit
VLWGLLGAFRVNWILQALLYVLSAMTRLGAPYGTNRLLAYLERGGADSVVRPWVWIAWVALAPFLSDMVGQVIMWLSARVYCQMEALLTALVYDHALRVRVIHRADNASNPDARGAISGDEVTVAVVPHAAASNQAAATATPGSDGTSDTATETASEAESSTTGTTAVSSAPVSHKSKADKKDKKDAQEKEKSKDLVGRLMNLVTSDLANAIGAKDFLAPLIETPLMIAFGSWFLWTILGNAAWVGLTVMVVLLPVPAWASKVINRVQKKKMEATDRRVKAVKETLGVLRMAKQFAWQAKVQEEIDAAREEELKWIFWRKIYGTANMLVK